jgi:glutamate dehydrogenase
VARAHAVRRELVIAPDVLVVAEATGRTVEEVAEAAFAVGALLRLDWIDAELERVRTTTRMERWALQAVREDAQRARRDLTRRVLEAAAGERDPEEAVARFPEEAVEGVRRLQAFLRTLGRDGEPDLAGLTLAVRQLRALADRPPVG